ncbi:MAG: DUF262 domain-containing protein [Proteobacteria bacterium]|nr:DUF262 domain-containing protein [Pseudomonadota bacterium]
MLINEIEESKRKVRTDAYQMSIGEIVSMYKDGDLIIDPEFQRLFRWEPGQKAKLIESILLGIPLPPIFVFEKEDAKWELIDGLQRTSTILEFMGILKGPDNIELPPSYLEATSYLPSLENVVWEYNDKIQGLDLLNQNELDKSLQLAIRRSRIGVEILKRPSDNHTKYDLFQRLNAAGTPANAQELRNCIIIMVNAEYFAVVKKLANRESFLAVISATDDQMDRQKHLEFASRFLTHTFFNYDGKKDVEDHINDGMQFLASNNSLSTQTEVFEWTFDLLNVVNGSNVLRKISEGQPSGRIGLVAFECIAVGVAKNFEAIRLLPDPIEFVHQKILAFWQTDGIAPFSTLGLRGTIRIQRTIPFGSDWFKP